MGETEEVTLAEAAELLGVSKRRVRQIVADGRLAIVRTVQLGALSVHLLASSQVKSLAAQDRRPGNRSGKPRTGKARPKKAAP